MGSKSCLELRREKKIFLLPHVSSRFHPAAVRGRDQPRNFLPPYIFTGGREGGREGSRGVNNKYRSFWGMGNPSSFQVIVGVGFPLAMHLSDTEGPGWSVCSLKW